MSDLNQPSEFLPVDTSKPALPSGLNVLTILTFIGSGIAFLGSIYNFTNGKKQLDQMEETINSPNYENMPAMAKKFMTPEMLEMLRKGYENRIPILLISLIAIALCVYGAMQMRKLKMQGYYMYLVGEILPLIPMVIFIGIGSLTAFSGIITIVIVLLFILLYTGQRKYLTK